MLEARFTNFEVKARWGGDTNSVCLLNESAKIGVAWASQAVTNRRRASGIDSSDADQINRFCQLSSDNTGA